MQSKWTQHLKTEEEKAEFERDIRNSKFILDRLNQILVDMERELDREEISPRAYDLPNWDYRQAHSNGFRQCLSKIKIITTLDQQEKK